jgi:neutral ceramidase
VSPSRASYATLLTLLTGACAMKQYTPGYARRDLAWPHGAQSQFMAAVRRVDVTPPALLGLFGHGPEGRVAVGTLGHLRCRVFYLSSAHEGALSSAVFVPCDLAAISAELHDAVVERVRRGLASVPGRANELGHDNVFLMATHTHAGPAHYFEGRAYSGPFGSSLPGFDSAVVDLLAGLISDAIVDAATHPVSAVAGWAYPVTQGLTRNRSMTAFVGNPPAELPDRLRAVFEDAMANPTVPLPERAVDTRMSVLRIDRCTAPGPACRAADHRRPMGLFVVFGMHPTVLPNTNDLYHGDVFAHAAQTVEDDLARDLAVRGGEDPSEGGPVVGIANGIEGDVSPTWENNSVAEMHRLGARLAGVIETAHVGLDTRLAPVEIQRDFVEPYAASIGNTAESTGAPVPDARDASNVTDHAATTTQRSLCPMPEMGAPMAGGASDHPTRYRFFQALNEGVRSTRAEGLDACHGGRVSLSLLGPFVVGHDFPHTAPIGLVRVGAGLVATLPVEITTAAGMRVVETLESLRLPGVSHATVVGLTDSYLSYVTTEGEFAAQRYEAASNLYGPWSAEFYRGHVACLARAMFDRPVGEGCRGTVALRGRPTARGRDVESEGVLRELGSYAPLRPQVMLSVCLEHEGGVPAYRMVFDWHSPEIAFPWCAQRVEVVREESDGPVMVTSSERDDLAVRFQGDDVDGWTARWFHAFAPGDPRARAPHRIRVAGTPRIESEPFTPGSVRACP